MAPRMGQPVGIRSPSNLVVVGENFVNALDIDWGMWHLIVLVDKLL